MKQARDGERRGVAMVAVLLVLMALFVLCAPFLLTVRNADRASAQMAERASGRVAVDSAMRHARAKLGASHASIDRTPYFDDLDELEVTNRFPEEFLNANDPNGVMWDLDVEDEAGRIDINSASPHVIANLLGCVSRLSANLAELDMKLQVTTTAGFLDQGFCYVGNEIVGYSTRTGGTLDELVRGVGAQLDEEGKELPCRPAAASDHDLGTFVIDQRAFALPTWRLVDGEEGELAQFDAIEQVAEIVRYTMIEELGDDVLPILERAASTHGGVRAGARWMRGSKLTGDIQGKPDWGCMLPVQEMQHFNPGTTVMITDGETTEFGLVRAANRNRIRLVDQLINEYEPFDTVIYPLARRPVNINTAGPEVLKALLVNLKLRQGSSRITSSEADELVQVIVVSRPFVGFEDFLRRVILPAAGLDELPKDAPVVPDVFAQLSEMGELQEDGSRTLVGFLDEDDAVALYKNAQNANDVELEFSTMPFSFTSRDVYRMDLRASVNAESGVERTRRAREEVELVVPQRDLMHLWKRQEDFDEEPRLDGEAPWWLSGPNATGRYDPRWRSPWPSRVRAHLGPHDTRKLVDPPPDPVKEGETAEDVLTFASREDDDAWLQLAASREPDASNDRRGKIRHFDDETEHIEGRYLPWGVLNDSPQSVGWGGALGPPPILWKGWIQPRGLAEGDRYLDLGGNFTDSDRITLGIEEGTLILRVLDAMGDHPASEFEEHAEVRYPLSEGPGLPTDVWTHVEVAVAGTRPDQMHLLVDGRWSVETPGLTRLSASISPDATNIPVESTDGFPDRCTIRIGDELIEVLTDGNSFRAVHQSQGENAGFGGRLARERFETGDPDDQNLGLSTKDTAHQNGAAVQLYGYSLPVFSNVPATPAALSDELGGFAVARAVAVIPQNEAITASGTDGTVYTLGLGLKKDNRRPDAIELDVADTGRDISEVMAAFSPRGGFAAILGVRYTGLQDNLGNSLQTNDEPVGGVELIYYTGVSGNQLLIGERGLNAIGTGNDVGGVRSFIFDYAQSDFIGAAELLTTMSAQTFVIPISIPYSGSATAFLDVGPGDSEFVQITRLGGEADQTEWVRFDESRQGHLLRSSAQALEDANLAAHAGTIEGDGGMTRPGPRGGGQGGGQGGGLGGGPSFVAVPGVEAGTTEVRRPSSPAPAHTAQGGDNYWNYAMGEAEFETEEFPVSRAVASHFQFRGVLGTHSHAHPQGTSLVPVWKTEDNGETSGYPGRFDHVALIDQDTSSPVSPAIVHRAHRPYDHALYTYIDSGELEVQDGGTKESNPHSGFETNLIHVALQEPLAIPFAPTAQQGGTITDTRGTSRVACFPSGERPRVSTQVTVGGDTRAAGGAGSFGTFGGGGGTGAGSVPSAVVDELVYRSYTLDHQMVVRSGNPGGSETPFAEGGEDLEVRQEIRTMGGELGESSPLAGLPEDAGLLRIGDEILCYDSLDSGGATLHVPPQGRGLLGTDPQTHMPGEGIQFLESWVVSALAGNMTGETHLIPVVSTQDFPPAGLVLIDDELLHYTHLEGGALAMPRRSEDPGERDGKGAGVFRGRFGTDPSGHAQGTPVILFPFRYWDRWSELTDDPELSYYEFDLDQPGAYWRNVFWDEEAPPAAGPEFGVLQRLDPDVPWDADPAATRGLDLFSAGRIGQGGNPIGVQADRAQWRLFVRYEPGSFDPEDGLEHGWKTTPKLTVFGTELIGPGRVLRRIDR